MRWVSHEVEEAHFHRQSTTFCDEGFCHMDKGEPNLKMCRAESNLIQQNRQTITGNTALAAKPSHLTPPLLEILNISTSGDVWVWVLCSTTRISGQCSEVCSWGGGSFFKGKKSCSHTVHCRGVYLYEPVVFLCQCQCFLKGHFNFGRTCCVDTIVMRVTTEQVGVTCFSFPVRLVVNVTHVCVSLLNNVVCLCSCYLC